jgi:hypothetical protein
VVCFLLSLPPLAGLCVIIAPAIWSKAARRAARAADAATSGLPLTLSPGRTSTPVGWCEEQDKSARRRPGVHQGLDHKDRESGSRSVIVRGDQNPSRGAFGVPPGRPLTEPGRRSRRSQLSGARVGLSRPDKTKYPDRDRASRAAPSFACRGTLHLPMAFGSFRP